LVGWLIVGWLLVITLIVVADFDAMVNLVPPKHYFPSVAAPDAWKSRFQRSAPDRLAARKKARAMEKLRKRGRYDPELEDTVVARQRMGRADGQALLPGSWVHATHHHHLRIFFFFFFFFSRIVGGPAPWNPGALPFGGPPAGIVCLFVFCFFFDFDAEWPMWGWVGERG
jgi:hypothetical protein